MRMRGAFAAVLAIGPSACATSSLDRRGFEGVYHRASPSVAELKVSKAGEIWRVEIAGAGLPRGAATAANCSLVAQGPAVGEVFSGVMVPFSNDEYDVQPSDLAGQDITVKITFSNNGAKVEKAPVFHCGVGSDLNGQYRRQR